MQGLVDGRVGMSGHVYLVVDVCSAFETQLLDEVGVEIGLVPVRSGRVEAQGTEALGSSPGSRRKSGCQR